MGVVIEGAGEVMVSVVVNNHNYARYLREAVDSALAQRYRPLQVVVVDDGSTDASRSIIAAYGNMIDPVLQENGGQAAAFNAGIARSKGQIVIFLDSDDVLLRDTVARVVDAFRRQPHLARVQYRMAVIDASGQPTGMLKPPTALPMPTGDLRARLLRYPDDLRWQPTSGNAFAAWVLRQILPMPTTPYRSGADYYLSNLTPLFGPVASLDAVGALYRVHGRNHEAGRGADAEHVRQIIRRTAETHEHLQRTAARLGLLCPPTRKAQTTEFRSVTYLANRLLSLKLAPQCHPLPGDTPWGVFLRGLSASLGRDDVSPARRGAYMAWFVLMFLAPASLARSLANRFLYAEARIHDRPRWRHSQRLARPSGREA